MFPLSLLDRWRAPPPDPRKVEWVGAQDYAHRGLHGAGVPENSLAAFQAAVEARLGIELDVQRSSDGQAVVFHDAELARLTGETGELARFSADQLGRIALAGTDQTIPTLRQVLSRIGGRVPVLIEIKTRRGDRVAALCLAVRRVLEGYTGQHAVISFDPRVSRWYFRHSRHTVRALTISEGEDRALAGMIRRRLALWHARPDFLTYDIRDLPSRFAARQRARGLPIVAWTIATAAHRERATHYADADIIEGEGIAPSEETGA
ncbi:glycerophosphodiester phosphodiesterase family protein [Novosphingobium sp. 9U]|uniref:glycerophosphodiester phosphodiesterase family protein n=1 Tax=Novosphingobium sp. 9U TaxID=2653158 RepID=UPI0012F0D958|nr:glycerophosphodiester phosphodiesterase family protein [Novosphingobium sp. 9U]VWX53111.1 Glycerophosphoryl diester phosphodiesterase [Novosphingobium sp. 9U]